MEPILPIDLRLPPPGSRLRLHELHRQLKAAIVGGRLATAMRLPATRVLAARLGVGRNTVIAAYERLRSDGYLEARQGAGYRVAGTLPSAAPRRAHPAGGGERCLNAYYRGLTGSPDRESGASPDYDFRLGVPDAASLDAALWRRLSARAMRTHGRSPSSYGQPRGQPALRRAVAAHVALTRAVACTADDVIVTSGAQQAFDLLARVLVTPGRTVVAVEHPGYPPTRRAFEAAGARIVAVPVDGEGLVVDALPPNARVVCVTPSHQYPLGCVMSARRRARLLAFAERHAAVLVEDDYDGEFRYDGRALDALQTLDRTQSVCYVGTFSKCLFPALRLGFVVAPPWAVLPLVAAKETCDWHCNLLAQDTLAAFIAEGHLARHLRRMHAVYDARRSALLKGLQRELGDILQPLPSAAGLHVAAGAAAGVDTLAWAASAREAGVGVRPIADYGAGAGSVPSGLLFGFGAIGIERIDAALKRLKAALPRGARR